MHQPKIDVSTVTTATTKAPEDAVLALEKLRRAYPALSFVRLQWQDYSGVLRARTLVLEACLAMVASSRFLHAPPVAFHIAVDSSVLPGTRPSGANWLVPDWLSLQMSSSSSLSDSDTATTAVVMCGVVANTPSSPEANGELCPRQALVQVVRQVAQAWQLEFLVGFEVEFQVMREGSDAGMIPYSRGLGHFSVCGLRDPCWRHVEECVQQLRTLGVHVLELHPEGHRGQYEIVLGPLPPLQAVDQLVLVHTVLKDTFARVGCIVTMSPKPVAAQKQATGQHMHVSLQPAAPPELEDYFLAGILQRLPSLWAFCLPQTLSYERVAPFMAGDRVAWGTENRAVPIRKIKPSHWEVRCIDATANMYLVLAMVLSAGLLGLATREPLRWPDMSVGVWAEATFQETETGEPPVAAPGELLPRSLDDSLAVLAADYQNLDTVVSRRMIEHYVKVKRFEASQMNKMDPKKARDLLTELF